MVGSTVDFFSSKKEVGQKMIKLLFVYGKLREKKTLRPSSSQESPYMKFQKSKANLCGIGEVVTDPESKGRNKRKKKH